MTDPPIDAYLARLHQDWLPDSSGALLEGETVAGR
jgi:hypothetical protein